MDFILSLSLLYPFYHVTLRGQYNLTCVSLGFSCCSDEISVIRGMLDETTEDKLKLSQKTSMINLNVQKNMYYVKIKISIPNNYPVESIK